MTPENGRDRPQREMRAEPGDMLLFVAADENAASCWQSLGALALRIWPRAMA